MTIKIKYGISNNNIDITHLALQKCMNGDKLIIPTLDHTRACLFSDPLPGTLKFIYFEANNITIEYDAYTEVIYNCITHVLENITYNNLVSFKIKYGILNNNIDITHLALQKCVHGDTIIIPRSDVDRSCLFSDPLPGVLKTIFFEIVNDVNQYDTNTEFRFKIPLSNINCKYLHPITFSIAEEKITHSIENKTKLLSSLIPGDTSTYIYDNEHDYYNEYKTSLFAKTTQKRGWDTLRHYEILANGAIPYFPDIEKCPLNTLKLLPKEMIIYGNSLYDKHKHKQIHELTNEELNECNNLIHQLLSYTKNNLTTLKMAEYILKTAHCTNASKILYLSGITDPDYLRCLTLHGFKTLFGSNCHDYPKIPHIYKSSTIDFHSLYGKGISYTNLLENHLHDDNLDNSVVSDIENKRYDVIIYGSYHRGMPFYDIITRHYSNDKIILLCGHDLHCCNYIDYTNHGHHTFVREL